MSEVIDNILVVKAGTSTLVETNETGVERLNVVAFQRLGEQILALQEAGTNVVVVSSAAITAGMVETGLTERPDKKTEMRKLQRLASIGWKHIVNEWDDAMPGKTIGGLLLTEPELGFETERDEALGVVHELLTNGEVPVANENDAITHKEIEFGDNDTLAAILAARIKQSELFGDNVQLLLLSDVNGVLRDVEDPDSVIHHISDVDAYFAFAQNSNGKLGTGGMITKFNAASIATQNGINMWIANGTADNAIHRAINGEIGTHFLAR